MDALCRDLCGSLPELKHIDPDRVLFSLSRSRAKGTHGVYARIAPLRFCNGHRENSRRRGRYLETFRMPVLHHNGRDILYLITLMTPRFLRLPLEQKLMTVIHELYHISEAFDGDIRRFPGRNFAHGHSRKAYNRIIGALMQSYLGTTPDPALLNPLQFDEKDWQEGRVRLSGLRVPLPKAKLVARLRV
ncbi:hypothetical protein AOP6_2447 [Desulfuromonas sp. AOP6]|nr:hypothetical protein AOP6_2447 [Desulfuromonas sp. AOP6]